MKIVTVNIPGKIMLAGEYSALKGGRVLAATINRFMEITLTLPANQTSQNFLIKSSLWGKEIVIKDNKEVSNDILVNTVLYCLNKYKITNGSISIKSNLDPSLGFGSSSAIRLGVLSAFNDILEKEPIFNIAKAAYQLQKSSQKYASGYDILTQLYGGFLEIDFSHNPWGKKIIFHNDLIPVLNSNIKIFSGGKGSETGETINKTISIFNQKSLWKELNKISKDLHMSILDYLTGKNPKTFFKINRTHRNFFRTYSPVFPHHITNTLSLIPNLDTLWTYKTTGAGGEDSILIISPPQQYPSIPLPQIKTIFSQTPLTITAIN